MEKDRKIKMSPALRKIDIVNKAMAIGGISLIAIGAIGSIAVAEANINPAIALAGAGLGIMTMISGLAITFNSLFIEEQMIINQNKIADWPGHKEDCPNKLNPNSPLIVESNRLPLTDKMGFLMETKKVTCDDCHGSITTKQEIEEMDWFIPGY